MADDGKLYTDREMALILRIASEADARGATGIGSVAQRGRTLGEIEAIAADAGIAPEAVRSAAAALGSSAEAGFIGRVLGAPTMFRLERQVDGEIDAGEMLELTGTARWMLAHEGELRRQHDGVEWQYHTAEGPLTHLELTSRAGRTRIRLLAKYEDPAGWTMIGAGTATGIASAFAIAAIEPGLTTSLVIVGAAGLTSWAGARAVWRGIAGRARRRLSWLMERLELQAAELAANSGSSGTKRRLEPPDQADQQALFPERETS